MNERCVLLFELRHVVSLGWVYCVIEGVHRVVTECDFI